MNDWGKMAKELAEQYALNERLRQEKGMAERDAAYLREQIREIRRNHDALGLPVTGGPR